MNHSVCDIAVGMILGYALARGIAHHHEHSALSDGADSMSEDRTRRSAASSNRAGSAANDTMSSAR